MSEPDRSLDALRAWLEPDGLRVCRDLRDQPGPGPATQPQHLAYISAAYGGTLVWENHAQGAWVPPVRVLEADAV